MNVQVADQVPELEAARLARRLHLLTVPVLMSILVVTALAVEPCGAAGGERGKGSFTAPNLDHFKCYRATKAKGEKKFGERTVALTDQFESKQTVVLKPLSLCTPVSKEGGPILDPARYLKCYTIKYAKGETGFARLDATVENQFGSSKVTVRKPFMLCLPSSESGVPATLNIDSFKCYKTKRAKGEPKFPARNVTLVDQFETRQMVVVKPRFLCNPVDRDGGGIIDPVAHLQCYVVSRIKGQQKFAPVDVTVDNDFGSERLTVKAPEFLCLPSTKTIGP